MIKKSILSPLLALIIFVALRSAYPSFVESVRLRYSDTLITS